MLERPLHFFLLLHTWLCVTPEVHTHPTDLPHFFSGLVHFVFSALSPDMLHDLLKHKGLQQSRNTVSCLLPITKHVCFYVRNTI